MTVYKTNYVAFRVEDDLWEKINQTVGMYEFASRSQLLREALELGLTKLQRSAKK